MILWLLGAAKWAREAAGALFGLVRAYPLHAALIASLCPRATAKYTVNRSARHSKHSGNCRAGHFPLKLANCQYIRLAQFGCSSPQSLVP